MRRRPSPPRWPVSICSTSGRWPTAPRGDLGRPVAASRIGARVGERAAALLVDEPTGQLDRETAARTMLALLDAIVASGAALSSRPTTSKVAEPMGHLLADGLRRPAERGDPMLGVRWVAGLVRRRPGRIVGLTVAVAMAVLLTASLGAFFSARDHKDDRRRGGLRPGRLAGPSHPGTDIAKATSTVTATGGIVKALPVGYAHTTSLRSSVGGTVQTTGPGMALGLPAGYAAAFPGEIRPLIGAQDGVLLAQQAAANLGVTVGADIAMAAPVHPRRT